MSHKSPEPTQRTNRHLGLGMLLAGVAFGAVVVATILWEGDFFRWSARRATSPTAKADRTDQETTEPSRLSSKQLRSAESSEKLPRLLRGHKQPVGLVALSESVERLLSADTGETIIVWDYFAGEPLGKFDTTGLGLRHAALSRNGKYVIACGKNPVIRMWNTKTGELAREFQGHSDVVSAVRFLPNRDQFLSSSFDGSLIVWDLESGERLRQFGTASNVKEAAPASVEDLTKLDGHFTWIRDVVVLPNGRQAISAGNDAVLFVWDLESGTLVNRLVGHQAPIMALVLSNDGRYVASVGSENVIFVWDIAAGALVKRLPNESEARPAVAFTADGGQLAIAGDNAVIRFVDVTSGEVQSRMETGGISITSLTIVRSPFTGESDVVCGCSDGTIRVWPIVVPGG